MDAKDLIDLIANTSQAADLTDIIEWVHTAHNRLRDAEENYAQAKRRLEEFMGDKPTEEPAPEMSLAEMRAELREIGKPLPVGRGASERAKQMLDDIANGEADFDTRLAAGDYEPLDWSSADNTPDPPPDAPEPPEAPEPTPEPADAGEGDGEGATWHLVNGVRVNFVPSDGGPLKSSGAFEPVMLDGPGIVGTTCPDCGNLVEDCGDDCPGF